MMCIRRTIAFLACIGIAASLSAQPPKKDFTLAPAVAVEAEDFTVERGWKVIKNGEGNYMVDIVGFNHISGERVLGIDEKDTTASAYYDVTLPEAGDYRLWVRYECPSFCEVRFRVIVQQGERVALDKMMGAKDNPKYWFGETKPRPQYDPPWGSEGLFEEVATVPGLVAGKARIYLKGIEQPQIPGVTAKRNIDLIYLTRDTADAWLDYYHKRTNLYPILDALRDTRGPRWEVRYTNRGAKPDSYNVHHVYNRLPWGMSEPGAANVKPGESSPWIGMKVQDTVHFNYITFASANKQPFDIEVRPVGGAVERSEKGKTEYGFYIPPYPGKGDRITTPLEQITAVRKLLASTKAPGKKPTLPLTYGGWIQTGRDDETGRAYAQLYADLGFRSLHPANGDPKIAMKNQQAAGIAPNRSWMAMSYRNPPTPGNIAAAKKQLDANGMGQYLQWFDYGDEIGFGEWIGMMLQEEMEVAKAAKQKTTPPEILAKKWRDWLTAKRPAIKREEYWLPAWGAFDAARLKPDSSAKAAAANPRLYVDSLIFYEETAIDFAAKGMKAVKATFGDHVWCGANYSGHPFYYPTTTMYIKWFRGGAADMGRHSEYFWQVNQLGPMINGYFAEHFRAGMRDNPKAVLRQYTMPHAPGNSDASFMRTAFSHLAHGAKMLDYFGIGMNECFTENHIDHRAHSRYVAMRDINHCIGFVEDMLPDSQVVPSQVALLVSESTERWDFAGIATDQAGHAHFGPDFRKTRLLYHIERLGWWKALTFGGLSPDLVIEQDLTPERMKNYKMLVLVGDHLPPEKAPVLEKWVKDGGTLVATAGAGLYDPYHKPIDDYTKLFGLKSRKTEFKETFFRPRQELPFMKPLTHTATNTRTLPVFAISETIEGGENGHLIPVNLAKQMGPSGHRRQIGNGSTIYFSALVGVSYLWSATQPSIVPDRSPSSHSLPTTFDRGANELLGWITSDLPVATVWANNQFKIDARLIKARNGYFVPLASYSGKEKEDVILLISSQVVGARTPVVTSAYHGKLAVEKHPDGHAIVTIPALGYGDILRIE